MIEQFLKLYFMAIVLDLITGVIASGYEGRLKSATMRKGLWTSLAELVVLFITSTVCTQLPQLVQIGEFFCMGMLFKEGLSIVENLSRTNVKLPKWLLSTLQVANDKTDETPKELKDKK